PAECSHPWSALPSDPGPSTRPEPSTTFPRSCARTTCCRWNSPYDARLSLRIGSPPGWGAGMDLHSASPLAAPRQLPAPSRKLVDEAREIVHVERRRDRAPVAVRVALHLLIVRQRLRCR